MLQIYQIITIWKYLNKLFLFTSQKRQNKRGHFKASFYSSPLFYPIAPTKPIVQLIRAYFTPISSMQNNQCEVLYPNCEPTSHFSPSFQSKMRSKWEALWFFVFLPVLLYLLYINIIRVIGFTFRISSYKSDRRSNQLRTTLEYLYLEWGKMGLPGVKSLLYCMGRWFICTTSGNVVVLFSLSRWRVLSFAQRQISFDQDIQNKWQGNNTYSKF